jgi:hypothetical protein
MSDEKFFNRAFWQMVSVSVIGQVIVLIIAIGVGVVVGGKIDSLIALSDSLNQTMQTVQTTIETAVGIDTVELQEKADALRQGAVAVGEGVGDGGDEVVSRIGDALRRFQSNGASE